MTNPVGHHLGIDWSSIDDLGVTPDTVIAKRLGCTPAAVRQARVKRGIPTQNAVPTVVDWDNEPDLGVVSDSVLAARHGLSFNSVRSARLRRKIPPATPPSQRGFVWTGIDWTKNDTTIAADHGYSRRAVGDARRRHAPETVATVRRQPVKPPKPARPPAPLRPMHGLSIPKGCGFYWHREFGLIPLPRKWKDPPRANDGDHDAIVR